MKNLQKVNIPNKLPQQLTTPVVNLQDFNCLEFVAFSVIVKE